MSTGVFAFDETKGATAGTDLGTVMTDLQSALDDLDAFVVKVKGDWDGDEMELYGTIHDEWKKNATTVQDILDGVHSAIGSVTTSVGDLRTNVRDSLKEQG